MIWLALLSALLSGTVPPAHAAGSYSTARARHPFPPAAGKPDGIQAAGMRSPGLRSGARIPLGHPRGRPATGYHAILERPVEGGQRPLFLGLLAFWRGVISPVNGSSSDLAPVHSLYAVQAITEYGVLLGMVLTTERLLHEGNEIPLAPAFIDADGRTYHHDPLVWNVFWLPDWIR